MCNSHLHMTHPLFSHLIMDITTDIDIKICEEEQKLVLFAEHNQMQLTCNERLRKDQLFYFEHLIVFLFFDKIIVNAVIICIIPTARS